jgi:hypothetical protein
MKNSKAGKIAEITWTCEAYELPVPQGMDKMSFVELKKVLSDTYKTLIKISKTTEVK